MTHTEWIRESRRRGGQSTSPIKAAAARENGKRGGRPGLHRAETQLKDMLGLSAGQPLPSVENLCDGFMDSLQHLQEASEARKRSDEHEQSRIEDVVVAAKEIIEAGYRLVALKYHPDRVNGKGKKMVDLNAAIVWLRGLVQRKNA